MAEIIPSIGLFDQAWPIAEPRRPRNGRAAAPLPYPRVSPGKSVRDPHAHPAGDESDPQPDGQLAEEKEFDGAGPGPNPNNLAQASPWHSAPLRTGQWGCALTLRWGAVCVPPKPRPSQPNGQVSRWRFPPAATRATIHRQSAGRDTRVATLLSPSLGILRARVSSDIGEPLRVGDGGPSAPHDVCNLPRPRSHIKQDIRRCRR